MADILKKLANELIEEASESYIAAKRINSDVSLFFEHAIKYKHNQPKQTSTWCREILDYSEKVRNNYFENKKVSEKQIDVRVEDIRYLYEDGLQQTIKLNKSCIGKYDVLDEFPTFRDVADKAKVLNFLEKYKYTRDAIEYLEKVYKPKGGY